MQVLKTLSRTLRAFRRNEEGNSTIEFVLVVPGFFALFLAAYEGGVLSLRHVTLENGLDRATRDVRIGRLPSPTHHTLTTRICEYASIIPDCMENVRLEMINRDPRAWVDPNDSVACVDREEEGEPVLNFTNGGNNELMVLRACVLFDPMVPTSGLGKQIPKKSGGAYALIATSSYVMEPFQK